MEAEIGSVFLRHERCSSGGWVEKCYADHRTLKYLCTEYCHDFRLVSHVT